MTKFTALAETDIPAKKVGKVAAPITPADTATVAGIMAILATAPYAAAPDTFADVPAAGDVAAVSGAKLARRAAQATVTLMERVGVTVPTGLVLGTRVWQVPGGSDYRYAITLAQPKPRVAKSEPAPEA